MAEVRGARLAAAIRLARIARRLTQAELATRTGVTTRTIQRWENNQAIPSLVYLGPLSRALDVPPEYFALAPDEDATRFLLV